jgi:hypothetical protein
MEHIDLTIQSLKQKEDAARAAEIPQSIYAGKLAVGGALYEFRQTPMLDGRISVCIPAEFAPLSEELTHLKYASVRRPQIILSDGDGAVNFCVSHLPHFADDAALEAYMETSVSIIGNAAPGVRQLGRGLSKAGDKPIAVWEFVSRAIDADIYNCMCCAELESKLLTLSFNCLDRYRDDWQPLALQMMESLRAHAPESEAAPDGD